LADFEKIVEGAKQFVKENLQRFQAKPNKSKKTTKKSAKEHNDLDKEEEEEHEGEEEDEGEEEQSSGTDDGVHTPGTYLSDLFGGSPLPDEKADTPSKKKKAKSSSKHSSEEEEEDKHDPNSYQGQPLSNWIPTMITLAQQVAKCTSHTAVNVDTVRKLMTTEGAHYQFILYQPRKNMAAVCYLKRQWKLFPQLQNTKQQQLCLVFCLTILSMLPRL
jgi:DNA mismatch repair ATPase MutL